MYLVPVCNFLKDYSVVIKTFNCKESKMIWEGKVSRKLPRDIQGACWESTEFSLKNVA